MLRTRAAVKKTRTGQVYKETKEHYLRKEIPCGIKNCFECKTYPNIEALDPDYNGSSSLFPSCHFLIPQSSILIKQIDLFENDKIVNVIILKTVLNEIQAKNIGIYNRLQNILKISEKKFYLFYNEYHSDTFLAQTKDESDMEWELRMFVKSCEWYHEHVRNILKLDISIIAIFNQHYSGNLEHFMATSVMDYVKSLVWHDEVIDSVCPDESDDNFTDFKPLMSKSLFPEHLPISNINTGVKRGSYLTGTYYQDSDNYSHGTVKIKATGMEFHIFGLTNINRAFTDDFVAVEIIDDYCSDSFPVCTDMGENFEIVTDCLQPKKDALEICKLKFCRVVGIIRRNWKQYCGTIFKRTIIPNVYLFKPMDNRFPMILFETKRGDSLMSKKLCVSIDQWEKNYRYSKGHLVRVLGEIGDKNVETDSILFERNIPVQKFSKTILDCLPDLLSSNSKNKPEWRVDIVLASDPKRKDLRDLIICSIDPPGCTDIDDALHCRLYKSASPHHGNIYEIGIHIADVTHYVLPGTAIDQEAYRRGTTVYLVDRRIDMLPELLSSNICSLKPDEDRLAFTVLCYIDEDGNFYDSMPPIYTRSAIRSRRAFTYSEAQLMIDDKNDESDISKSLKKLCSIMKKVRQKRIDRGALVLSSAEVRFEVDSETNEPIELQQKESLETNRLVEDCMLLANILVARKIYQYFPSLSVLRRHPHPSFDSLNMLCEMVSKRLNINLKLTNTTNLSSYLDNITSHDDPYINKLVRIMSIRCLQQAVYFCSGNISYEDYYHYGLAEELYTHFTSPIRRYPDILVHRLLATSISNTESNIVSCYDCTTVQRMCEHLNRRHTCAQIASRESIKLHLRFFIKNQFNGSKIEKGYVTKLHNNAISVYIPSFHHECLIKFKELINIIFDHSMQSLTFTQDNIKLSVFDKVTLKLETSDASRDFSLNYYLLEPYISQLYEEIPSKKLKQ